MEWGIGIIVVILIFTAYVIVQETRAQLHWRGLVDDGDVDAIRRLVEDEAEHWRSSRVPKGVPALLWHGIQTVELIDVTAKGARLSANAEGEYSLVAGRRIETSSPLNEGMKITQKLAEMALYDIPNVKLDHVQIDIYTSFRDDRGHAEPRCILSTRIERPVIEHIDWEQTAAAEFVEINNGRFAPQAEGNLLTIDPLPWEGQEPAEDVPSGDVADVTRRT
ncbi:MAG TPA: hypothetical protein VJB57_16600 [Dehalococcoidia bacterium]|nr:hypothetical protein [Dehalococcoidia bacterium]